MGEGWGVASLGRGFGVGVEVRGGEGVLVGICGVVAVGGGGGVLVGIGGVVAVVDGSAGDVGERVKVGVAGEAGEKPFLTLSPVPFTALIFTEAPIPGSRA